LRLNRALEEIEKLKSQLAKTQSSTRDTTDQDKKRVDAMQMEIKRLQKQKLELIQAFKKQLKLIDILKKQKMHLEAARMLQFSEEEFINALEWNSSNSSAIPTTNSAANQRPPPPSHQPNISSNTSSANVIGSSNKKNQKPPLSGGQSNISINSSNSNSTSKVKNATANQGQMSSLNLSINGANQMRQQSNNFEK
jgi:HAMP domain-containing protein